MCLGWWLVGLKMVLVYRTLLLILLLVFSIILFAKRSRLEEKVLAKHFGVKWDAYADLTKPFGGLMVGHCFSWRSCWPSPLCALPSSLPSPPLGDGSAVFDKAEQHPFCGKHQVKGHTKINISGRCVKEQVCGKTKPA